MRHFIDWFLSLFGIYTYQPTSFTREELAIVERLTKEANDIAAGKYRTQSSLPEPVIPERRKSVRK